MATLPAKTATTQPAPVALRPTIRMTLDQIRNGPKICIGRYTNHLSGWTDAEGQNRCRRCHAVLLPKGTWAKDYFGGSKATARSWRDFREFHDRQKAAPPPVQPHNPNCPHPPPMTDPMAIHRDAQQRMAAGERQRQCEVCGDWVWAGQFAQSNGSQEGHLPCVPAPNGAPEPPDGVQTPPNA